MPSDILTVDLATAATTAPAQQIFVHYGRMTRAISPPPTWAPTHLASEQVHRRRPTRRSARPMPASTVCSVTMPRSSPSLTGAHAVRCSSSSARSGTTTSPARSSSICSSCRRSAAGGSADASSRRRCTHARTPVTPPFHCASARGRRLPRTLSTRSSGFARADRRREQRPSRMPGHFHRRQRSNTSNSSVR